MSTNTKFNIGDLVIYKGRIGDVIVRVSDVHGTTFSGTVVGGDCKTLTIGESSDSWSYRVYQKYNEDMIEKVSFKQGDIVFLRSLEEPVYILVDKYGGEKTFSGTVLYAPNGPDVGTYGTTWSTPAYLLWKGPVEIVPQKLRKGDVVDLKGTKVLVSRYNGGIFSGTVLADDTKEYVVGHHGTGWVTCHATLLSAPIEVSSKPRFKTGEPVLVRHFGGPWTARIFKKQEGARYGTFGQAIWDDCIPFDETLLS